MSLKKMGSLPQIQGSWTQLLRVVDSRDRSSLFGGPMERQPKPVLPFASDFLFSPCWF